MTKRIIENTCIGLAVVLFWIVIAITAYYAITWSVETTANQAVERMLK